MKHWLTHTIRGLCMGLSDAIPGVSGGTIALILGIYPRLIEALGSLGPRMLRAATTRSFWVRIRRALGDPGALGEDAEGIAAGHVLFLASLGFGVGFALVVGARFLPTLLDLYPAQMKGLFLGLVLASVVIPYRMIKRRTTMTALLGAGALVGTLWFVGLPENRTGNATGTVSLSIETDGDLVLTPQNLTLLAEDEAGGPEIAFGLARSVPVAAGARSIDVEVVARMAGEAGNLPPGSLAGVRGIPGVSGVTQARPTRGGRDPALAFVFLAGVLAISAMILPGLSGSFVLLLLGLYHYVTHALRMTLFLGDLGSARVVVVMLVAIGVGLLSFSRVLKWLFARAPDGTLAVLVGLMLGSLRKLWPFTEHREGREVLALPVAGDAAVAGVVLMFLAGMGAVLLLETLGRRASRRHSA